MFRLLGLILNLRWGEKYQHMLRKSKNNEFSKNGKKKIWKETHFYPKINRRTPNEVYAEPKGQPEFTTLELRHRPVKSRVEINEIGCLFFIHIIPPIPRKLYVYTRHRGSLRELFIKQKKKRKKEKAEFFLACSHTHAVFRFFTCSYRAKSALVKPRRCIRG